MKRSFLGRLDIYTQRLSDWLGSFPRWGGGTWAEPPETLDEDWQYRHFGGGIAECNPGVPANPAPMFGAAREVNLVQESDRGYGAYADASGRPANAPGHVIDFSGPMPYADEPEERLNTFGPGVDEAATTPVTVEDLIPSDDIRAIRQCGARIMEGVTRTRERQEAAQLQEAAEGVGDEEGYGSKADHYEVALPHGVTEPPEMTFTEIHQSISTETLKKIDPKLIEGARQQDLPPHAKNLGQNPARIPPGRGKGQQTERRTAKRASPQWRGRYCDPASGGCGRHSGGPRSVTCQHCFEKFK